MRSKLLLTLFISSVLSTQFIIFPGEDFVEDANEAAKKLIYWKALGVDAVSTNVYWDTIDNESPRSWEQIRKLVSLIRNAQLKWLPRISFHDHLPESVKTAINNNVYEYYKPKPEGEEGKGCPRDPYPYYVSLAYDKKKLNSQTLLEQYNEFMEAFKEEMNAFVNDIIAIQIGLGPEGELVYPSTFNQNGECYTGVFMIGDSQLSSISELSKIKSEQAGCHEAIDIVAKDNCFWAQTNNQNSDQHKAALKYSTLLFDHGYNIMTSARDLFSGNWAKHLIFTIRLSALNYGKKPNASISTRNPNDATYGYFNYGMRNAYETLAQRFKFFEDMSIEITDFETKKTLVKNEACQIEDDVLTNNIIPTFYEKNMKYSASTRKAFLSLDQTTVLDRLTNQPKFFTYHMRNYKEKFVDSNDRGTHRNDALGKAFYDFVQLIHEKS